MKIFALTLIASFIIHVCSQIDSAQQVTLSCPVRPEGNRGPAGVPGKRGSKGESGSSGKIWYSITKFCNFFMRFHHCLLKNLS